MFNNNLIKNGFNLIDSSSPVLPEQGVTNFLPQTGLPAQPYSGPAPPPQQFPFQPPQAGQQPPLPVLSKGFSEIGQSLYDTATNQANNIFSGVNEVIKGTDEVMNENGYQFQKINSAGKEFLKQASRTKGAALSKVPEMGTGVMKQAENFVSNPTYYMNLMNIVRAFNPFRSAPNSPEQKAIDILINKIKYKNGPLHMKLVAAKYVETVQWLRKHPDIFIFLLQDENFSRLDDMLENPILLKNFLEEVEHSKYR